MSSSINLTSLDFDSNKASLKAFLRSQDEFKDYDFEGSNINVLLDLLSHNTYLNAFYLNQLGGEAFLDTAQIRESVVSHAKELNYLPRSFSSAIAKINITVKTTDTQKKSLVVPKGTNFLSRIGQESFTFSIADNMVSTSGNGTFLLEDVPIYEGTYLSDTYAINYDDPLIYKITNKTVDLSSLSVTVIEDNGSIQTRYTRANSLLGLDANSTVFFLQAARGDSYEVLFGDDIIAKRPKNNSIILLEYRICSGELPNGASKFISTGRIDDETDITITTVSSATFGSVAETLNSIKFNAPRAFTTQERAITSEDYENLLRINFPEISSVSAFGGEDAIPPQYGKIFVSVDLRDIDALPDIKKEQYTRFLRSRSSVAMEPIFISPEYTYVNIKSNIKYDINKTLLSPEDIRTLVISSIIDYSNENLNNFNRTLRYSKLIKSIDDTDLSVISNDTDLLLIKYISPETNTPISLSIDFKSKLEKSSPLIDEHNITDYHTITSSPFTYGNKNGCILEDDGNGTIRVVVAIGDKHKTIINTGTIDYDTGKLNINNLNISKYAGSEIKIYAKTSNKDIISSQNTILNILESDIEVTVDQVRE
jgi:hypothetical protein